MAEVYICRLQGIGGFEKEVVVKRIVPERAEDPEFVKMFLDEARVGANLNHPNIVQIFEIGEDDGLPYIAMEYVKGVTLAMIIRQIHRHKKNLLHYGHCARIVSGICEGLDYAHNAVDANGEPLRLIHRDVSPANIVVSREGVPKLLDFGVAKAAGRLSETHAGTIKGKIAYMAPEQVSQGVLDHRADIFSLGVCLYELTVGRNPFKGQDHNEVTVLKNVIHGVFQKPSEVNPDFPKDLEAIILQAMAQDVHKRCVSARDLRDRLEAFLAQPQYTSNARAVTLWLRELFTDFNNLTTTGSLHAFTGTPAGQGRPDARALFATPTSASTGSSTKQLRKSSPNLLADDQAPPTKPLPAPFPTEKPSSNGWKWAALAILVLVGAGVWWNSMRPPPVAPVAQAPVPVAPPANVASDDDSARIYLDGAEQLAKEKRFELAAEVLGKATKLTIKSADLNIRMAKLTDVIIMGGILKKASSLLKDKDFRGAIDTAKVALDRDSENAEAIKILTAARAGVAPTEVAHVAGKTRGKPARDGSIAITTSPAAMVYIDDEPLGRSPIARRTISAGMHTIQVRAQGHAPSTQRITVSPGQALALNIPLAESSSRKEVDDALPFKMPTAKASPTPPTPPTESPPAPTTESPSSSGSSMPAITAKVGSTGSSASPSHSSSSASSSSTSTPKKEEPTLAPKPPTPPTETVATKPALPPPSPTTTAPAPPKTSAPVVSVMPKSPVPKPTLPREPNAKNPEEVAKVCNLVESAVISLAGVTPEFARGVTGQLRRQIGGGGQMYGVAMYYFIVREASLQHDNKTAAANLAAAQTNGFLLKLKNLPANDRDL